MTQPTPFELSIPTPVHSDLDRYIRENAPPHIRQAWEIQQQYFADVERTLAAVAKAQAEVRAPSYRRLPR